MDVVILFLLILLNGLFAMSEIALVTARRSRLQRLAEDGDSAAQIAIRLGENPTRFLSTVQIGMTAIGILNGIAGEAAFAKPFALWLEKRGFEVELSETFATVLVVVVITYLTIVLGELVPKRVGQNSAETIARLMARPIALLALLSRPFVTLLSFSTETILRLLGLQQTSAVDLTEDDLHAVLVEGSQAGLIEKHEHDMVKKVFQLEDRQVGTLMTPRNDIVFWDVEQSAAANLEIIFASNYSLFPVCRGGLHQMLGVVSSKRLLELLAQGGIGDLAADLEPGVFVPESLTGMKVLEKFRASGGQMVFAVDEYGEILGLLTLKNILEALVGEFSVADPQDLWAVQRDDGSWLLDGLIPIPELKDRLQLKSVPEEDKNRYHTLSGMMMYLLSDVPRTGNSTLWEEWRLEVVDMDGNRLDKVLASRVNDAKSTNQTEK